MVKTDQTSVRSAGVFQPNVSLSAVSSIRLRSTMLDAIFWPTFIHTEGVKWEAQSTTFKGSSRHRRYKENVDAPLYCKSQGIWWISDSATPDNLAYEQTLPLSCHGYPALEWLWSVRRSNMRSTLKVWISINFTGSCKTTFKLQVEWQCYL